MNHGSAMQLQLYIYFTLLYFTVYEDFCEC